MELELEQVAGLVEALALALALEPVQEQALVQVQEQALVQVQQQALVQVQQQALGQGQGPQVQEQGQHL